jgi:hypothetical protein
VGPKARGENLSKCEQMRMPHFELASPAGSGGRAIFRISEENFPDKMRRVVAHAKLLLMVEQPHNDPYRIAEDQLRIS